MVMTTHRTMHALDTNLALALCGYKLLPSRDQVVGQSISINKKERFDHYE